MEGSTRALQPAPGLAEGELASHLQRIQALYDAARWEDYQAEVDHFEAAHPGSPYAEYERGYLNLLRGNMLEGWRQFEARLRTPGFVPEGKRFPQPRWTGSSFEGRTLLVAYEQGFGDTLMLARYLPMVKALGGRVVFLVQPQFAYLMTTLRGPDQLVSLGQELPPFDLQVSLFSLPGLLGTDLAHLPAEIPYLGVPRDVPNQAGIAEALSRSEGQIRVGLAWGGNPAHPRDTQRSIPASLLESLGILPGVAWHSFQLGREELPDLPSILSLAPLLKTFSDTAYALSGMDLVITVDTALAHLAGALGVPTLLLVSHAPDFRWMLDRDDSPWYPTFRIYRQPKVGDWRSVMEQVVSDLAQ